MIRQMIEQVSPHLPIVIEEARFEDPALNLNGSDWSLTTTSAWRIVDEHGLVFGCFSTDAADQIWDIIGAEVVEVRFQSKDSELDPALALSNGQIIEIFSADTLEPWVFKIANQVWVAAPEKRRLKD